MPDDEKKKCPCCREPLTVAIDARHGGHADYIVYCRDPKGTCKSPTANDGGRGKTEQAAYLALIDKMEKDPA